MFGFALLLRSSFRHSLWPPKAARCSAVRPFLSKTLLMLGQSQRSRIAMRRRKFPRAALFSTAFSILSSSHIPAHRHTKSISRGKFKIVVLRSEFRRCDVPLRACAVHQGRRRRARGMPYRGRVPVCGKGIYMCLQRECCDLQSLLFAPGCPCCADWDTVGLGGPRKTHP